MTGSRSSFADRARGVLYDVSAIFAQRWRALDLRIDGLFGNVRDDALVRNFEPDATAIEEAPVPISAHATLYVVLALLVAAVIWSVVGTLDRIVVAQGKIATRTPLIVVQPYTTSRINRIYVKPGDHVSKGQVLVSFDPAFAQADQASLEHKVRELTAQVSRIEAELAGAPTFIAGRNAPQELQIQAQIFVQEMAEYKAEMDVRDSRVAEIDSQIRADDASIAGLTKQVEMAKKAVDIYKYLLQQNAAAPLDVMSNQSKEIDFELHLKNTAGEISKFVEQRAEIQAERQTFLDKWQSDHSSQLAQARQDLTEATQSLRKASAMSDLTQLKSPVDAVVLEIADRSVGSVMREAETLITLVPDSAELYLEAQVPSRDVSFVKVGNRVRVKLEAYPFQRYGTIDGKLDVISPDSVPLKQDDQSQLVYRAQVGLVENPRELAAHGIHLRPGLVASAEIKTGERSIASYVLNPILRTSDEGLREP